MSNYKNLRKLIGKVKDDPSWVDSEYGRNVSELIKLIPWIGSAIDANTIQKVKDKKLEKRLIELEEISERAVREDDIEFMYKIVEENRIILYNFISHFREIISKDSPEILNTISSYIAIPEAEEKVFVPHEDFKFVVISGASATGKDVQLDALFSKSLARFRRCDILRKYTTREKRLTDSEYHIFIDDKKFEFLKKEGKILFPYKKREFSYGFDKEQFIKESSSNTILLCVFTEFGVMKTAKQFLDEQGIDSTFILFEADLSELIRRSSHRNFPPEEVSKRIKSIKYDLNFIHSNEEIVNSIYDYRIHTGDKNSVDSITNQLTEILEKETRLITIDDDGITPSS